MATDPNKATSQVNVVAAQAGADVTGVALSAVASQPPAADKASSVPGPEDAGRMPLHIYLRIRAVPEWAWRAREVYEAARGHGMHTAEEWDAIFRDF